MIRCEEIYEDNRSINFVLELVKGGDLFDHIIHSPNRKLTEDEAIDIFEQILQALSYLHNEIHVVHRDIKPENFLMYEENGRNRIKLIDFGFAMRVLPEETMTQQLGTPLYAAPEIFEEKPYTNKVDLWSAGIVLYNMINGMHPFTNDMDTIKEQVCHREINFNGFSNPKIKTLCMGLLERDSSKRLSAIQALSQLRLIQTIDPTQQTVPSNFNPNIHKIIYILNNDRALGDELRNLFLEYYSLEELKKVMDGLNKQDGGENETGMLVGKKYFKAEIIINYALNQSFTSESLKEKLNDFKQRNGEEKIKKQMINTTRFFYTAIECKKFIQKQRVWHEFKQLDKVGRDYLTKAQVNSYFTNKEKRKYVSPELFNKQMIEFEDFYKMWNEYNEIKIEPSPYQKKFFL